MSPHVLLGLHTSLISQAALNNVIYHRALFTVVFYHPAGVTHLEGMLVLTFIAS